MLLKMTYEDFKKCPFFGTLYLTTRESLDKDDFGYYISDDFIRDINMHLCGQEQTNFTTKLIQLMFKADISNQLRLSNAWPAEMLTIWAYKNITNFYLQLGEDNISSNKDSG